MKAKGHFITYFFLGISYFLLAQKKIEFKRIQSLKSKYSFCVPMDFKLVSFNEGNDVEYSFCDDNKVTVVSLVKDSQKFGELELKKMASKSKVTMRLMMEKGGLIDVQILKTELVKLNGVLTFIQYFTDGNLGNKHFVEHLIQSRDNKLVALFLTGSLRNKLRCEILFSQITNSFN